MFLDIREGIGYQFSDNSQLRNNYKMATNGTKSKMNMHNMKKKYLIKFFLRYITRIFALSRKKIGNNQLDVFRTTVC